ncbi:MAG: diguanylate cyclase [Pseudomonadota bacterium]
MQFAPTTSFSNDNAEAATAPSKRLSISFHIAPPSSSINDLSPGTTFVSGHPYPNFGLSDVTLWIRAIVREDTTEPMYLTVNYPLLDELIFYRKRDGEYVEIERAGDHHLLAEREIKSRYAIEPVGLPAAGTEYLILARSGGSLKTPIGLYMRDELMSYMATESGILGFYYGFMALLAAVVISAAIYLRDSLLGWYGAYVASLVATMFGWNGFAYLYLWPTGTDWVSSATALFIGSSVYLGQRFAGIFLQVERHHWSIKAALNIAKLCSVVTVVSAIFQIYPFCVQACLIAAMSAGIALIALTVSAAIKRMPGARYFLVVWGIFLSVTFGQALELFGVLETRMMFGVLMQGSTMVDVVIIAVALMGRARNYRMERDMAVEQANAQLGEMNLKLEKRVQQRTYELMTKNEELRKQASRDSLTGLLNHKATLERVDEALNAGKRFSSITSVIMVDIDGFKSINDRFGHPAGDQLLSAVSGVLRAHLRQYDVCGRYGGDEFLLLLSNSNTNDAMLLADRLRLDVELIKLDDYPQCSVTASFGVAFHLGGDSESGHVIEQADIALYEAKQRGRNRIVSYSELERPGDPEI